MNDSDLEQKYSQKDEYEKKYSQKNRKQNLNVSINFAEYDEQNNELYYEEVTMKSENKYETFAEFVEIKVFCIKCKTMFSFKNKLHKHLKMSCKAIKSTQFYQKKSVKSTKILNVERSAVTKSIIMKFTTFTSNKDYELTFRKWNYIEALIKLESDLQTKSDYVCLNIDTDASLIDRHFILKRLFKTHIHLMTSSLIVRKIDANVHEIKKYVNFSFYLSSKNDSVKMIEIHKEMHFVKKLKINMFIENNILKSKEIIINVQSKKAILRNCQNLIIEVKIHQRESFVRRNVISQFANIISLESYVKISYKMKNLFSNRDFLFESFSEVSVFIYAHVIDVRITDVIVRNESAKSMKISRNFKLEIAQKIHYDDYFHVSQKHHLTLQTSKKNFIFKDLNVELTIENSSMNRSRSSLKNSKVRVVADEIDEKFEEKISFEVIAYEDEIEKQKFDKLINEFSKIWKDERFIDVSKEQWMRLSLKEEWQNKMTTKIKIYSFEIDDRKMMNNTFNRL